MYQGGRVLHSRELSLTRSRNCLHHAFTHIPPSCTTTPSMPFSHIAAEAGDLDMLALLVQRGATLDIRDTSGATPLHLALEAQVGGGWGAVGHMLLTCSSAVPAGSSCVLSLRTTTALLRFIPNHTGRAGCGVVAQGGR